MKVVGLTGGIATGKSSALRMFRKMGAKVLDADEIVRKLYRKESVKEMLVLNFGGNAVDAGGNVDRKYLAEIIFSGRDARLRLNGIVHPLVNDEIRKRIAAFRKVKGRKGGKKKNKKSGLLVVEVPLLFESRSEKMYDRTIVVGCERKVQFARMKKAGISKKEAVKRIATQMPLARKSEKADFFIGNNGTVKGLETEVKKVFEKIISRK